MSFTARISSETLPVEPGASATLSVEITNNGAATEPYEVSVEGLDPEWIAIPQSAVQIEPGRTNSVLVLFRPPRGPESAAGDYPFVARVRSLANLQDGGGESQGATGILRVKAFHHLALEISPKKGAVSPISRDNHFDLTVMNLGNAEHTLQLSGSDPEDACVYEWESEHLEIGPGQQREIELDVNPRRRSAVSSTRLVGFTATARSVDAPSVVASTQAQLEVRPLLSPAMLAVLAGLLVLVGVLWAIQPKPPTLASLRLDKTSAVVGDRVTVTWQAGDPESNVDLKIGGVPFENEPASGSREILLENPGTLTITASAERKGRRSESESVSVNVDTPAAIPEPRIVVFEPNKKEVRKGETFVLRYEFKNVASAKLAPLGKDLDLALNELQIGTDTEGTAEYTVVALNKEGKSVRRSFKIEVTDPSTAAILDFSVSPKEVEAGQSVTIRWSVTGAAAIRLEYAGTGQDLPSQTGTIEVPVEKRTTFTLRAIDGRNKAVTRTGAVKIKVSAPVVLPEDGTDPVTGTNGAENDPANAVDPPVGNGPGLR